MKISFLPKSIILIAIIVALIACKEDEQIISDDWGSPAGYATIEGEVTDSSGNAVSRAPVFLHYCLWDSLPNDTLRIGDKVYTDEEGYYQTTETLPPVGVFQPYEGDILSLKCEMITGSHMEDVQGTAQDTVNFYREESRQEPSIIDLVIIN